MATLIGGFLTMKLVSSKFICDSSCGFTSKRSVALRIQNHLLLSSLDYFPSSTVDLTRISGASHWSFGCYDWVLPSVTCLLKRGFVWSAIFAAIQLQGTVYTASASRCSVL
ncbi:hypothetical protein C8R43DRAFT_1043133 [Mycena crocata]|nr:hypothetical protein C8R43DRAFT_1043133 [Mycena crocata]